MVPEDGKKNRIMKFLKEDATVALLSDEENEKDNPPLGFLLVRAGDTAQVHAH